MPRETPDRRFRLLFFKRALLFPRASGHDVHCYHMMKALAALGQEIDLVTLDEPTPEAVAGLTLRRCHALPEAPSVPRPAPALTWLQERFRSYFGVPFERLSALAEIIDEARPDAFVSGGLDILPYFAATSRTLAIWYAADELAWHHLSLLDWRDRRTWMAQTQEAAIKAVYERAFNRGIDRAWVVSATEARAMRWLAGISNVDIVPNGVDTDFFQPIASDETPRSAVFWGRLDFEPNVQGLTWFCREIWPAVRRRWPDARFTIIGFQPIADVRRLADRDGITLMADVPDLRAEVSRRATVVLPFVSGGGIKNKLLEAASLAKAIVCTPRACSGLRDVASAPFLRASTPEDWLAALGEMWDHPDRRQQNGALARAWVLAHHTWEVTAREALNGLRAAVDARSAGTRS